MLFIRPDYLLSKDVYVIHCKKGDYIYHQNDSTTDTYYIARGTVEIIHKNNISYLERGKFFGEEACILNELRNEDAISYTDVEIVRITADAFLTLIEKNPAASRKVLAQISTYYAKVYGRRDDFRL
jgi:membrane protein